MSHHTAKHYRENGDIWYSPKAAPFSWVIDISCAFFRIWRMKTVCFSLCFSLWLGHYGSRLHHLYCNWCDMCSGLGSTRSAHLSRRRFDASIWAGWTPRHTVSKRRECDGKCATNGTEQRNVRVFNQNCHQNRQSNTHESYTIILHGRPTTRDPQYMGRVRELLELITCE